VVNSRPINRTNVLVNGGSRLERVRAAGFSAVTAAKAARARAKRAADCQRLVAVALEPFLDVEVEVGQPVVRLKW